MRFFWTFILLIPILFGCAKNSYGEVPSICVSENRSCLQGKAIVELRTTKGTITLELDGDSTPVTAGNFLDLVKKGVYENTVFHRVIRSPYPFVIQGGDPFSNDIKTSKSDYGKGNYIDPKSGKARFIPLEIKLKKDQIATYNRLITNPSQLSQLELTHQKGSLAMARSQRIDSASAQFYIALKALPELDGRYSVFGRVLEGIETLNKIEQGDIILGMKQIDID